MLTNSIRLIKENKPLILIGGISGSGKTTIGNALLNNLELDHSIGTGWIRQILTTQLKKEHYPELFTHSFRPITDISPFANFTKGSNSIAPAIEACLKRARSEGTSLIVEGVYLMPGIIEESLYDYFFMLESKRNLLEHKKMVLCNSHQKRKVTELDIQSSIDIESKLLKLCEKTNTPTIPNMALSKRIDMINRIMIKNIKENSNVD